MSTLPTAPEMTPPWTRRAALALAILAVLGTTILVLAYAGQPPLDRHAFRQTQTALTAYWFIRDGYRLAYETPVGGYPWLLPFEFPLYQAIVAALSQASGLSISLVGRLVSYAFLLLCIPAVAAITRRLGLSSAVLFVFVGLAFTTPVLVYWGRTVLIETSALFFGLMAIKYGLDYLLGGRRPGRLVPFALFMTLSMLQKITTGLSILMVLALLLALGEVRQPGWRAPARLGRWAAIGLAILVPLAFGYAWTSFTDAVKQSGPLGPALSSAALTAWNWGTPAQRLSADLWKDVLMGRVVIVNLAGIMGVTIILSALVVKTAPRIKPTIVTALALGLLPLFLFTNLHIRHDYYQSSNVIFLTYALAVAVGGMIVPRAGGRAGLTILAALMAYNCFALSWFGYISDIRASFGSDNRNVAVGRVLARELPEDRQFVAFGNDYSSTFAFLSGRKSFGVPGWFRDYAKVVARPGDYVEKGHLGAVVSCESLPSTAQLLDWSLSQPDWKMGRAAGCAIAVPAQPLPTSPQPGACRGGIDKASLVTEDGRKMIDIAGWSATPGNPPQAPGASFVQLRGPGGFSRIVDTLRVPRPGINAAQGLGEDTDLGFSRLMPADLPSGTYSLAVIDRIGGEDIACPASAALTIP